MSSTRMLRYVMFRIIIFSCPWILWKNGNPLSSRWSKTAIVRLKDSVKNPIVISGKSPGLSLVVTDLVQCRGGTHGWENAVSIYHSHLESIGMNQVLPVSKLEPFAGDQVELL